MIRSFLVIVVTVATFLVGSFVTVLIALLAKDRRRVFFAGGKVWAWCLLWAAGVKLRCHGREHLPQQAGMILVANHQGDFDIPILFNVLPDPFLFIVKKELFRIPLFGWYMRQAGYLAIDRQDRDKADVTLAKAVVLLKEGKSILLFPEGTRSRSGEVGYFKRGAFALAEASGQPVVPIAIRGSFQVKRRGSLRIRPAVVDVYIEEPVFLQRSGEASNASGRNSETAKERQQQIAETVRARIAYRVALSER